MSTPYDTIKAAIIGNPPQLNKKPSRQGVVKAFAEMQTQLEGAQAGAIIRDTKANLQALTSVPYANMMAWVTNDPVVANNGIYQNTGTASAAAWTRRMSIPQFSVTAINTGAGTPNAISATTDLPVPTEDGRALIALPIVATNTASPVTVSLNGGSVLTIKTGSGNDVAVGGLMSGMVVAGYVSGSTFRLLSDQSSAAIVAEVEAAKTAAEDARDQAVAAAGASQSNADSAAAAELTNVPATINYIRTAGYASAGDGGGALYKRVESEPSHDLKIQSADGAWWEIAEPVIHAKMAGAKIDGTTNDTAAYQRLFAACTALGRDPDLGEGRAVANGQLNLPLNRTIRGGDITLDFTGATLGVGVQAEGADWIDLPLLAASPAKGSRTLTFASAPALAPNDIIGLRNPTDGSFNGVDPVGRSYYRAGEYCLVKDVSGTTVTLWEPLLASYSHTVITTHKFSNDSIKFQVGRLTVLGGNNVTTTVRFSRLRDATHDNISAIGGQREAMARDECYNIRGSNLICRQGILSGAGIDYGLVDGSCHKTYASGEFSGRRHGYTSGNGGGKHLPCRFMHIVGNFATLDTAGLGAANAHGNSEFYKWEGTFHGPINLGGDHGTARGTIHVSGTQLAISGTECLGASFDASGVKIFAEAVTATALIDFTASDLGTFTTRGGTIDLSGARIYAPSFVGNLFRGVTNGSRVGPSIQVDLSNATIHEAGTGASIATSSTGTPIERINLTGFKSYAAIAWSLHANTKVRGWRQSGTVDVTTDTANFYVNTTITFGSTNAAPRAPTINVTMEGGPSLGGKSAHVIVFDKGATQANLRLVANDLANFASASTRTLLWTASLDE